MGELKLAKLPDRMPAKLIISVMPDLNRRLQEYSAVYAEAYGQKKPVTELIPSMSVAFLDGDRGACANL